MVSAHRQQVNGGCSPVASDRRRVFVAFGRALTEGQLPRDAAGLPVFDLMLIGVGDDGHVGSLYPGREEVRWSRASGRRSPPRPRVPLASRPSRRVTARDRV